MKTEPFSQAVLQRTVVGMRMRDCHFAMWLGFSREQPWKVLERSQAIQTPVRLFLTPHCEEQRPLFSVQAGRVSSSFPMADDNAFVWRYLCAIFTFERALWTTTRPVTPSNCIFNFYNYWKFCLQKRKPPCSEVDNQGRLTRLPLAFPSFIYFSLWILSHFWQCKLG
jgi:hypothetical protein